MQDGNVLCVVWGVAYLGYTLGLVEQSCSLQWVYKICGSRQN